MNWLFAAVVMLGAPADRGVMMYDFQASWCSPCRQMAPTVDQLALDGYNIKKVDIDQNRELANRFGVKNIPCFVITVDGHETSRVTGLTSFNHLRNLLDQASAMKAIGNQKAPPAPVASMPPEMPFGPDSLGSSRMRSETLPATAAGPVFSEMESAEPMVPISYEETAHENSSHQRSLPVTDEELISCTVRIHVEDAKGRSTGTGTIIDSRRGWALVLTCGHLFRDAKENGGIEVERFVDGRIQKTKGVLRSYNLDRDLGLVSFRISEPVRIARVAPSQYDAKVNQSVAGVGCSHGDDPTVMFTRVVSKNSIVGPPNLKTAGLSVEGRSGGGLFSQDGMLLGVCNFAMPSDNAAVFAASESIRAELDRAELSYVYKNPQGIPLSDPSPIADDPLLEDFVPAPNMPEQMPIVSAPNELTDDAPQPTATRTQAPASIAPGAVMTQPPAAPANRTIQKNLTAEEAAALEEIRRRRATGSEVICIIRSRTNPSADTEIFVLDKASPEFFRRLAEESSGSVTR